MYLGGDRLFKSTNRGDTWMVIARPDEEHRPQRSADHGRRRHRADGLEARRRASYGNIVTLAESPLAPGVLWVGTDDGNVQVSRDGGANWTNVTANIKGVPDESHVSRVEPSRFDAGTAYVSFDNHRRDDQKPYIFVTRDFGQTWTSIAANLPRATSTSSRKTRRIRTCSIVGTEYGFFISRNGGKDWKRFMTGLPTVRIDDVLVHPRDNDLVLGTHGRSIWILDDITPLQQMTEAVTTADAHLFNVRPATAWVADITKANGLSADKHFRGQNPQGGVAITYYLKEAASGDVKLTISDSTGRVVREMDGTKEAGLNRVQWNLAPNPIAGFGRGGAGGAGGGRGRGGRGVHSSRPTASSPAPTSSSSRSAARNC